MPSHVHGPRPELQALVDDECLDELLTRVSLEEVASAWCCYHERWKCGEYVDQDDVDWWAVEFWLSGAPVYKRRDVARRGLLALVRGASGDVLVDVGAGPIENFIEPNEGDVRWLEEQARSDIRFKTALGVVYLTEEEPWVEARLRAALGDAIG